MPIYYVGPGGNDGNSGLTWALRKLTLNGAEDVPVIADDTVYVAPGVYRERLDCDVDGNFGNPITYIADVTGEYTDGVGGLVRITGSDNDQTCLRDHCIDAPGGRDYRTFRGFVFDGTTSVLVECVGDYWIVEDCWFQDCDSLHFRVNGTYTNCTLRRCVSWMQRRFSVGVQFTHGAHVDDSGHLVENCIIIAAEAARAIQVVRVGGVTIRNSYFRGVYGLETTFTMTGGQTTTVENCTIIASAVGLRAAIAGQITEDFNNFRDNVVDRQNVAVGANSVDYLVLLKPPILHAGDGQVSGYKFPALDFSPSVWSQTRALAGNNEPAVDLHGVARPAVAAKNSWGPVQFHDVERDTGTVRTGAASLTFHDAARSQFIVPTSDVNTTISVFVQREANYAGVNPQMIIKQPGQADRITTDVAAASLWNHLTDNFTPAALPSYVIVELVSNNTAVAGNYDVFFDSLSAHSRQQSPGEFEHWMWNCQALPPGKVVPKVKKDTTGEVYVEINNAGDLLKVT